MHGFKKLKLFFQISQWTDLTHTFLNPSKILIKYNSSFKNSRYLFYKIFAMLSLNQSYLTKIEILTLGEYLFKSSNRSSVYRNVIDMIITEEGLSRIGCDGMDYNITFDRKFTS